jgi:tetratricopeptide (TPR) repeat protein
VRREKELSWSFVKAIWGDQMLQYAQDESNKFDRDSKIKSRALSWKHTMMAPITHGIAPPLDNHLRLTSLRNGVKRMNTIQQGEVLFVRTLISPTRKVATSVLVEDCSGDVIMLNLYNFVQEDEDPRKIFPPMTHLAILEPYFRFALDDPSKGAPNLRCDNPQAIVIFDNEADWREMQAKCTPAEEFRQQGNKHFSKKEWKKSIELYSRGLRYHPSDLLLLSNRAASYLKLGAWNSALDDANAVLLREPENTKALYRHCLALLYLQRPEEALEGANRLLAVSISTGDSVKEIQTLISDLEVAVEEKRGHYDLRRIKNQMKTWPSDDPHRHMDFTHSSISLRDVSGKGRGMFAMEDLPIHSLIVVSRAFALADVPPEELRIDFSSDSNKIKDGSQALLVPIVIHKLLIDPSCGSELYSLTAGPQYSEEMIDPTRVDVLRIHSILSNNQFGGHSECLERVLKSQTLSRVEEQTNMNSRSGLWIKPSFFNHSCAPNCHYQIFGDLMFVFTNRAIQRDQELTIGYVDPRLSYTKRTQILLQFGNGFECLCERCIYSHSHPSIASLQEEIVTAYHNAAQLCQSMQMNIAAENSLPSSRRLFLLNQFYELPVIAQGEFLSLLELEAICQFITFGNQCQAIQLCQQQIEIEISLYGKVNDSLELLKAKLRLFLFVSPAHPLANEILEEMYQLFCSSSYGLLSTIDFLVLCKRYVVNPSYHPHISQWLKDKDKDKASHGHTNPSLSLTVASALGTSPESMKQQKQKTKKGNKK